MAAACVALDFPVVSGNVSLYNETRGTAILPTPAIGGLGVLEDAAGAVGLALRPGMELVLVGETAGHLGQSLWLRELCGREDGPPPPVDLAAERLHGDFVRDAIRRGEVAACHDASDGGLLVAIAEMALAGGVGATLAEDAVAPGVAAHAFWFGEDQARYVLASAHADALLGHAAAAGVPARRIGCAGDAGEAGLTLPGGVLISLSSLRAAHERFFPEWMGH